MRRKILVPAWTDGRLEPVEKMAVHRQGLRHKAVSVFVVAGNETLLQRRAETKYHTPGLWTNACCTHPEWDEDAADCAARRLGEELGIRNAPMRPKGQVEYRADVGGGLIEHEVVDLFVAEIPRDAPISPDPDEVSQVAWMGVTALGHDVAARPERYTPWLRIYLAGHAGTIFGESAKDQIITDP